MKQEMKRQGSTELPRFAVGALGIAGASSANAATVQITFNGSFISSTSGDKLVVDFGGDGFDDVTGRLSVSYVKLLGQGGGLFGQLAYAGGFTSYGFRLAQVIVGAGVASGSGSAVEPQSLRGLVPITFGDTNISSGVPWSGWLDITASATQPGEKVITVHRLIFDDASATAPSGVAYTDGDYPAWQVSAVPEPGSNLALLALGAGGLTLRRRLKRAA